MGSRRMDREGRPVAEAPALGRSAPKDAVGVWTARVPASSANLGSGFDVLGMAVDLELVVRATFDPEAPGALSIAVAGALPTAGAAAGGAASIPTDETNLIYRAFRAALQAAGEPVPGVRFVIESAIPPASGLGSSAAAIAAGLILARGVLGARLRSDDGLALAVRLEGHPDNVAAAFFGGLVAAWAAEEGAVSVQMVRRELPLRLLALVPERPLSTASSRAVLPKAYSRPDVVDALGKVALLVSAVKNGDWGALKPLFADRLHQPYRLSLVPGAEAVFRLADDRRCLGMYLSGAGPTIMALFLDEAERAAWLEGARPVLEAYGFRPLELAPSAVGARVETPEGETLAW